MIWTWQSDVQQVSSGWRLTSVGVEVEKDCPYDGEEYAPGVVSVEVCRWFPALCLPVVVVRQVGGEGLALLVLQKYPA